MVFLSRECNDYLLNNITAPGGKTLQDLVKVYREEYRTLSMEEKEHLVEEYRTLLTEEKERLVEEYRTLLMEEKERLVEEFYEFKVSKAVGVRTTAKSKINNVTNTLKAVETEVCFLPLLQMFITTIFLALQSRRSYRCRKHTICSPGDHQSSAPGNCLRN